jgi:SCY1-like protein 2
VGVATLRYLDTLYEKGDMERSQYFKKNLALVITKLPKRIIHQRVIPALKQEFRNNKMVPFVLPIILLVAEDCTMQEYGDVIMPVLIPALRIQDPIQVPLILLQKMDLLLKKTSPEDVRQHVLPTIITSLETTNTQLQGLCISLIPSFATTVDYSSMKHSIVPRLTALMVSCESVSLRVKCLVAVGKMLDSLDKHIVHDHILPLLQQIPSREPAVLMAILGIYHAVMKNKKIGMDKVLLATRILPFVVPLSVEPTLNVAQFNQFMVVIRDMLQCVETEQLTHLEQLSQMEEQTRWGHFSRHFPTSSPVHFHTFPAISPLFSSFSCHYPPHF